MSQAIKVAEESFHLD